MIDVKIMKLNAGMKYIICVIKYMRCWRCKISAVPTTVYQIRLFNKITTTPTKQATNNDINNIILCYFFSLARDFSLETTFNEPR